MQSRNFREKILYWAFWVKKAQNEVLRILEKVSPSNFSDFFHEFVAKSLIVDLIYFLGKNLIFRFSCQKGPK